MNNSDCRKNPVHVFRDVGYSKVKSISPDNRRKAKERMDAPDIVSDNYKLKELYMSILEFDPIFNKEVF